MSLVRFLIILGFGTIVSWAAWFLVVTTMDPQTGGAVALALFYVSLYLALLGTITIIGFFIRHWLEREGLIFQQLTVALRQAVELGAGSVIALLLQSRRLLNAWSLITLLLLVVIAEAFFLAGQAERRQRNPV